MQNHPHVCIINECTVLTDEQIAAVVPDLQIQVSRDFAPVWGIDCTLSFVGKGKTPPTGSWWLVILDDSTQEGSLGFHETTSQGLPCGKVFAKSDIQYGMSWSVTVSHELLELLVDPFTVNCASCTDA